MSALHIAVIEGTTRKQRQSIKVARYLEKVLAERDEVETILVDPNDFNLPGDGNDPEGKDPKYGEITKKADGFVIVTPEYNHSFPGSLKRLLDSELENYIHKPVTLVGVSAGMFAGVRAIESLVPVVRELGMTVTFSDITVGKVHDAFDDSGNLNDSHNYVSDTAQGAFDELLWMAKSMKWGRENLDSKYHIADKQIS